jgi:hypothetical protein
LVSFGTVGKREILTALLLIDLRSFAVVTDIKGHVFVTREIGINPTLMCVKYEGQEGH